METLSPLCGKISLTAICQRKESDGTIITVKTLTHTIVYKSVGHEQKLTCTCYCFLTALSKTLWQLNSFCTLSCCCMWGYVNYFGVDAK